MHGAHATGRRAGLGTLGTQPGAFTAIWATRFSFLSRLSTSAALDPVVGLSNPVMEDHASFFHANKN